MPFENIIETLKFGAKVLVLLFLMVSIIPPLIMFFLTGELDYWATSFVGAVVPWWVGLPEWLIVITVLLFVTLDLEELL